MLSEILIHHPNLRRLVAIWAEARGPEQLPLASAIDPVSLGAAGLLPSVWVLRGTCREDYHFCLVGEEIRANFAENPVGTPLREVLTGEFGALMFERICRVFEDHVAHFSQGPVVGAAGRHYLGTRIMLPMVDDKESGGQTAVLGGFEKSDEKTRFSLNSDGPLTPTYKLQREQFFDLEDVQIR